MNTITKTLLAGLCAASLVVPAAASASEVRHREIHQENRIYQGVKSGEIPRGQYDHLQAQETRLNDRRIEDLENHDGHLTGNEYRNLNRDENHLSHEIYRDKHDGPN